MKNLNQNTLIIPEKIGEESNIIIGMDIAAKSGGEYDCIIVMQKSPEGVVKVLDHKILPSNVPYPDREKAFNDLVDKYAEKYNASSFKKDGSFQKISEFEKKVKKSLGKIFLLLINYYLCTIINN